MAINFSNNATLGQYSGGVIYAPGRIVQTVHTTIGTGMITSSTSPVDFFSASITLKAAANKLVIEFHSDNRCTDWGDGVWNLHYMQLVHVGTGAVLTHSGYNGEQTNCIRHVHRSTTHIPGSVGPHTYKVQGWSYQASSTYFNTGADQVDNDGTAYIRITEIAV
jgi:predicted outer membrane repeat protein